MTRELFRLSTFSSFTACTNFSLLKLARCGFCYDGTQGTIRCEACDVGFGPLEHSSSSILDRHREQSPYCRFALSASAPNIPPNLPDLFFPVGGHTASDDGSQIGPDDRMRRTFSSALARATKQGIFQATANSNREPSGSFSLPETHADPQVLNQGHVVYKREQASIWPVNGSGSDSPSESNAHSQGLAQGDAVYRRERPDYERLQHEEPRLHTFHNWPVNACVGCRALAREGFFYTGQGDRVQCAFCRGYLKNWKATDVIKTKHQKYSPNCPFLRGLVASERPSHEQTSQPSSIDSQESDRNQRVTIDDPVSAVMDREEVSILIPIVLNLGFNDNDLRTLVAARLSRGDDCLIPRQLLEALLTYQRM